MKGLRWYILTRRHPCAILLLVQLVGILAYPFIEGTPSAHTVLSVFGIAVLLVSTRMVHRTPGITWVSAGLAVPAILLLAAQAAWPLPQLLPWSSGLEALFYFYAAGSLSAYMLADRKATTDELFGAAATFTLLAWGFAYLFLMLQALQPEAFIGLREAGTARTWTELMFLSFALLSSTGIGDVLPISPHARSLASLEMFVGIIYLAAVVSRLIGLTLQERQ